VDQVGWGTTKDMFFYPEAVTKCMIQKDFNLLLLHMIVYHGCPTIEEHFRNLRLRPSASLLSSQFLMPSNPTSTIDWKCGCTQIKDDFSADSIFYTSPMREKQKEHIYHNVRYIRALFYSYDVYIYDWLDSGYKVIVL
jgi:hypothetical protein